MFLPGKNRGGSRSQPTFSLQIRPISQKTALGDVREKIQNISSLGK